MTQQNKPAAAAVQLALAPTAPVAGQSVEPTPDNPLPNMDMRQVPGPFKIMVGAVMHNLRKHLKDSTRQSNQCVQYTTGSKDFPWATADYVWPRPFKLTNSPTFADYFGPIFFRI
jgi:hypothetical protein